MSEQMSSSADLRSVAERYGLTEIPDSKPLQKVLEILRAEIIDLNTLCSLKGKGNKGPKKKLRKFDPSLDGIGQFGWQAIGDAARWLNENRAQQLTEKNEVCEAEQVESIADVRVQTTNTLSPQRKGLLGIGIGDWTLGRLLALFQSKPIAPAVSKPLQIQEKPPEKPKSVLELPTSLTPQVIERERVVSVLEQRRQRTKGNKQKRRESARRKKVSERARKVEEEANRAEQNRETKIKQVEANVRRAQEALLKAGQIMQGSDSSWRSYSRSNSAENTLDKARKQAQLAIREAKEAVERASKLNSKTQRTPRLMNAIRQAETCKKEAERFLSGDESSDSSAKVGPNIQPQLGEEMHLGDLRKAKENYETVLCNGKEARIVWIYPYQEAGLEVEFVETRERKHFYRHQAKFHRLPKTYDDAPFFY